MRELNAEAFESFLKLLHPDREQAAERYEQLRQRLTKLFQWRGCVEPEEYADRTLDRAASGLASGREVPSEKIESWCHGVGLNLLREYWRGPARMHQSIEHVALTVEPKTGVDDAERGLECLEECLRRLPPETRRLVLGYHSGEAAEKIAGRKRLAKVLGIPLNALRLRVFRIRGTLESCTRKCLGEMESSD